MLLRLGLPDPRPEEDMRRAAVKEKNRGPTEALFAAVPARSAWSSCPATRGPGGRETVTDPLGAGVEGPLWELLVTPWMPTKGRQRAKSRGRGQAVPQVGRHSVRLFPAGDLKVVIILYSSSPTTKYRLGLSRRAGGGHRLPSSAVRVLGAAPACSDLLHGSGRVVGACRPQPYLLASSVGATGVSSAGRGPYYFYRTFPASSPCSGTWGSSVATSACRVEAALSCTGGSGRRLDRAEGPYLCWSLGASRRWRPLLFSLPRPSDWDPGA
ncbi:hypothetical protein NDU88_002317 [Pleurodeles waltl]|uniref:Uncharacterized protein n=1 Tax=Pleurodeles waltl TaxID=8319 RepID=A0AAV7SAK5_PLEWA|nr:hypothetical protein NDU88_002317 [Pleurodeles waltl]